MLDQGFPWLSFNLVIWLSSFQYCQRHRYIHFSTSWYVHHLSYFTSWWQFISSFLSVPSVCAGASFLQQCHQIWFGLLSKSIWGLNYLLVCATGSGFSYCQVRKRHWILCWILRSCVYVRKISYCHSMGNYSWQIWAETCNDPRHLLCVSTAILCSLSFTTAGYRFHSSCHAAKLESYISTFLNFKWLRSVVLGIYNPTFNFHQNKLINMLSRIIECVLIDSFVN